jgi:hypothetical protein
VASFKCEGADATESEFEFSAVAEAAATSIATKMNKMRFMSGLPKRFFGYWIENVQCPGEEIQDRIFRRFALHCVRG